MLWIRQKVTAKLRYHVRLCNCRIVLGVQSLSWEYSIFAVLMIVLKTALSNGSTSSFCSYSRELIAADTFCLGNVVSSSCWHSELKPDGNICGISGNRLYKWPLMSCEGSQSKTSYFERLRLARDCVESRVSNVGTHHAPRRISIRCAERWRFSIPFVFTPLDCNSTLKSATFRLSRGFKQPSLLIAVESSYKYSMRLPTRSSWSFGKEPLGAIS